MKDGGMSGSSPRNRLLCLVAILVILVLDTEVGNVRGREVTVLLIYFLEGHPIILFDV